MASWAPREVQPDPRPKKRTKATNGEWAAIRGKFDGTPCVACGDADGKLECHHIVPRSQGGDDVAENLCVLCRTCHTRLEGHESGWERVAASVRVYVLTSRERCLYMRSKVSWEQFSARYPLLSEGGEQPGKPDSGRSVVPPPAESDWDHWEKPDERVSPWEVDDLQPWLGEL